MIEPSLKPAEAAITPAKKEEGWWETVKVIIEALLIALVVRTVLFQPFNIPSGSLVPTLLVGDYLFVSKYAYGYSHFSLPSFLDLDPQALPGRIFASEPKRGDIIVFKLPSDGQTDYIKRLIGLPGDKIQVTHGRLIINGEMVPREPIAPFLTVNHFNKPMEAPQYLETLPGGVQHQIIQIDGDEGTFDNTKVYEVPPGHYFMMGDNRDNSSDSRLAGDQGGRRLRAVREPDRQGRGHLLLDRRGDAGVGSVAVAVDGALEPHLPAGALAAGRLPRRARRRYSRSGRRSRVPACYETARRGAAVPRSVGQ